MQIRLDDDVRNDLTAQLGGTKGIVARANRILREALRKGKEKQTYYCYEVLTPNLSNLGAFLLEAERDAALEEERTDGSVIEEWSIGTVQAYSVEDAENCIRRGEWEEVTQKL